MLHYTYEEAYPVPNCYYIVASQDVGPSLFDLLKKPEEIKKGLIEHWSTYCRDNISQKKSVLLKGDFKNHVEQFDFSILENIPVRTLIDQHAQTKYHTKIFGIGLQTKPISKKPPQNITDEETVYVKKILAAYSEAKSEKVTIKSLDSYKELNKHFNYSRECFYSAETFKQFARDRMPDNREYDYLANQIYDGIQIILFNEFVHGYERMQKTCEHAIKIEVNRNILGTPEPKERVGMCHQFANDDKIDWVGDKKS